jgi:hypothetical protein
LHQAGVIFHSLARIPPVYGQKTHTNFVNRTGTWSLIIYRKHTIQSEQKHTTIAKQAKCWPRSRKQRESETRSPAQEPTNHTTFILSSRTKCVTRHKADKLVHILSTPSLATAQPPRASTDISPRFGVRLQPTFAGWFACLLHGRT